MTMMMIKITSNGIKNVIYPQTFKKTHIWHLISRKSTAASWQYRELDTVQFGDTFYPQLWCNKSIISFCHGIQCHIQLLEISSVVFWRSEQVLVQLQWILNKFIFHHRAAVSAHRMQKSLSLPTFKRKQLRHEPYPSQPPPPLGTRFLPLSRTDTQSVFFCPESRHIYSALCSAHLNSHHASCSFPFPLPFFFLHSSVVRCPGIAHWSRIQPLMWVQARAQKTRPCYHGLLEMFLLVSSFAPDFSHSCCAKLLIRIQLINHLKSSELMAHAYTNRFLTWQ